MSGWRIVPVDMTPEMYEADVRCACDFKAEQMLGSGEPFSAGVYACYRAQLAAAPEPDWEAMAEPICIALAMLAPTEFDAVVAALKATFGSKP